MTYRETLKKILGFFKSIKKNKRRLQKDMLVKMYISFAWRRIRTKGLNLHQRRFTLGIREKPTSTITSPCGKSLEQIVLID